MASLTSPYSETWLTVWIKSLGMFLIGLATVAISFMAVKVQRSVGDVQKEIANIQKENSQRGIELSQANLRLQEKSEHARLAVTVIPFLKCDNDQQRAAALTLLTAAAPEYVEIYVRTLSERCQNLPAKARTEIDEIRKTSLASRDENEFLRKLASAREYKSFGHDGPAARLFDAAYSNGKIPGKYERLVNTVELSKASNDFKEGKFSEAADRFVNGFAAIRNPE